MAQWVGGIPAWQSFLWLSGYVPVPAADMLLSGYINGKAQAEEAVLKHYAEAGVVLRPSTIYGDRRVLAPRLEGGAACAGWRPPLPSLTDPLRLYPSRRATLTHPWCSPVPGFTVSPHTCACACRAISHNTTLPLGLVFQPLEMLLARAPKTLVDLPVIGGLFVPPVSVEAVARAAVKAALDSSMSGVLGVPQIQEFK